jgi:hypothetical protein
LEEVLDYLLALSDVLAHDVAAGDAEEGGLGHFMCAGFGEVGFAGAWGAVEQYAFPGFAVAFEYFWEA